MPFIIWKVGPGVKLASLTLTARGRYDRVLAACSSAVAVGARAALFRFSPPGMTGMTVALRYGASSTLTVDLPPGKLVAHCDAPRGRPLENTRAIAAALASPLILPPLGQCVAPGDKIAIPLDPAVPLAAELTAEVVSVLLESGASPSDIAVLQAAGADESADPRRLLPDSCRGEVCLLAHDPTRRNRLSLLGRASDDRPLYLNRALCEADFVLPIGCLRPRYSATYLGPHGGVYPLFADAAAARELSHPKKRETGRARLLRALREASAVGQMLGAFFTLQVVPGAGNSLLHVIAGDVAEVERQGRRLCREAWSFPAPERSDLAVATIEGPPSSQTWSNLGRALRLALGAVVDGGAILVCCETLAPPGPAVECLARMEDPWQALKRIERARDWSDAAAAADIARVVARARVFLLSRLDDGVVEDLGMNPVANSADAARLIDRAPTCSLLANAHLISTTVAAPA